MQTSCCDKRLQFCPHKLSEQAMACSHACGVPWTGHISDYKRHDLACTLQIRIAGPALTSLRTYCRSPPNPAGGPSRSIRTVAATAQKSANDRSNGALAETLVDGVTQSLALGLSAASVAADSLARIQRIVGPLPAGFPPGVVCMLGWHVLTAPRPIATCLKFAQGTRCSCHCH